MDFIFLNAMYPFAGHCACDCSHKVGGLLKLTMKYAILLPGKVFALNTGYSLE